MTTGVTEFKIRVGRLEMISPNREGEDICLTFHFDDGQTEFAIPIFLRSHEFDDTEIVKVARSRLHDVFGQLCRQCADWQLTTEQRDDLVSINVRPNSRASS